MESNPPINTQAQQSVDDKISTQIPLSENLKEAEEMLKNIIEGEIDDSDIPEEGTKENLPEHVQKVPSKDHIENGANENVSEENKNRNNDKISETQSKDKSQEPDDKEEESQSQEDQDRSDSKSEENKIETASWMETLQSVAKNENGDEKLNIEAQEEEKTDIMGTEELGKDEISSEGGDEKQKTDSPQLPEGITKKNSPNVFFYKNRIKSKPQGAFIEKMLTSWFGKYRELEVNHSYIQWLFPNFYQSAFNDFASALTKQEAEIFRTDKEIAERLVRAYELILDFFGIKVTDRNTGKLARTEKYEPRYKSSFLTYFHNHLRMRRILTHLNNVGFRRYSIELVNFLEKEIYGQVNGYEKFKTKNPDFNVKAFEKAPLKDLAKVSGAFEVWRLYGDHKDDPEKIQLLEKNCFAKYPEDFQDSIFFQK